jgi:hypothetical protein
MRHSSKVRGGLSVSPARPLTMAAIQQNNRPDTQSDRFDRLFLVHFWFIR